MTEKPVMTSKLLHNGILYEQVYNPNNKITSFIGWNPKNNKLDQVDSLKVNGVEHLPIKDEGLAKKAILLPTNIMEFESVSALEQEIYKYIYKYVDISKEYRQKATWYIMLSWITDKINTIPYLRTLGDYGTGKTRYEDVIGGLCYKPMFMSGAVRSAPIYRIIDMWQGTTIFDEFTLHKSDQTEDIIKILNNGYQRGKPVIRCASDNYDNLRYFDPFGPKVISSRAPFTDKALESRCITEIMKETDRPDIPIELPSSFYEKREELRNKLLFYRFKTWDKINIDKTIDINFGTILPRIKQSFLPFTVLFQHDKNTLNNFIKQVKQHNSQIIDENSTTLDGIIVQTYIDLISMCEPYISAAMIRDNIVTNHGFYSNLKASTIGKHLKGLGFENKLSYIDKRTVRAVEIDDNRLIHLVQRYIPEINQKDAITTFKNRSKKPTYQKIIEAANGTNNSNSTNGDLANE
ncbi:MAG: hypothetical protein ACFE95_07700 [Candidatus Hodarchaeota archaeon]